MNSITVENLYDNDSAPDEVARLPGEAEDGASLHATEAPPDGKVSEDLVAEPNVKPRKVAKSNLPIFAGVGVVALLMGVGYLSFHSRYRPQLTMQAGVVNPAGDMPVILLPLAPSASLANVPVKPLPPGIVHHKYVPQPRSTELSELQLLRNRTPAPLRTLTSSPAPTGSSKVVALAARTGARSETATASQGALEPVQGVGAAHISATPPSPTMSASLPSGTPAIATLPPTQKLAPDVTLKGAGEPGSTASIAVAAVPARVFEVARAQAPLLVPAAGAPSLQAAPVGALSAAQQIQLFQLVTELASIERNDRIKEAVLSGQVQELSQVVTAKLTDLDRRLSIEEAQTAVSGALQAGSNTAVAAVIAAPAMAALPAPATDAAAGGPPTLQSQATPSAAATPPAVSSDAPADPVQYHVQAASPGLAMLSVVGGDAPPLEVQVGDIIPGYGRVTSVLQQGDSWVVETQSGNIE